MAQLVFWGVSPRSLGDLLKGYGIMAIIGEDYPDSLFWWDDGFHLVAESHLWTRYEDSKHALAQYLGPRLVRWGMQVAASFKPASKKSCNKPLPCPDHPTVKPKKGKKTCPVVIVPRKDSVLKSPRDHDALDPEQATWARAIALPKGETETEAHPLFPGHGQEGRGDYFLQIEKAAKSAEQAAEDLVWSLFAEGTPLLRRVLDSGYLFFPEPMKRYATGIARWVQENNAPVSPWCFLLAMRGALLLRGSLRRFRWGGRSYPAFPFVFEGTTVQQGKGSYWKNIELHLPTWTQERPRTLVEFEMQMRQFYVRLSGRGFAGTAAEFRAAVAGRGAGAAFDCFHRFVLEGRRPSQQGRMHQGMPRGLTRVRGIGEKGSLLRLMLAPLAEVGWLDQFITPRLRMRRALVEEAVHRAIEQPGLDSYRGLLEALWDVNRALVLPGAARRDLEEAGRKPQPLPPLPARLWETALEDGLRLAPAYRLGRALGSIVGVPSKNGAAVGPILEHMVPVRWSGSGWALPDRAPSSGNRWSGFDPLADFRALLWSRWLDSSALDHLPFKATRTASLADVVALLRGEVDPHEVHRLASLFALLDWQEWQRPPSDLTAGPHEREPPVHPAYAALRLWLDLGIRPAPDGRSPRDGGIARLLTLGSREHVERASQLALRHLQIHGLPWHDEPRPLGKAVAHFLARLSDQEAACMGLAVMTPISEEDTLYLARLLLVPADSTQGRLA